VSGRVNAVMPAMMLMLPGLLMAAMGCQEGAADRYIKERMNPVSLTARLADIENEQPDVRREALTVLAADRTSRADPEVVKLFCLMARHRVDIFKQVSPLTGKQVEIRVDTDPMVRSAAVRGLAYMDGEGVVDTIADSLLHDKNVFVRCDAAQALGSRVPAEGAAALIEAVKNDTSTDVRVAAAESLRQFQNKAAADALVDAVQDADIAIAMRSWESLRFMTGQDLPRETVAWRDFFATTESPFAAYGKPPPMLPGDNQRPMLKTGLSDFFNGLFRKDIRQAELD
jgi:hypothetical protein